MAACTGGLHALNELLFDHPVELLLDKLFDALWPGRLPKVWPHSSEAEVAATPECADDLHPGRAHEEPDEQPDEPHAPRRETSWDRAQSPGGFFSRWERYD